MINSLDNIKPFNIILNQLCLAKYHRDGCYYKSRVIKKHVDEDKCTVFFMDHGNEETISNTDLKELPAEFHDKPPLALACAMNCSSVDPDGFMEFAKSYTSGRREVTVQPIVLNENRMIVKLYKNDTINNNCDNLIYAYSNSKSRCGVCLVNPAQFFFIPCGHASICRSCNERLKQSAATLNEWKCCFCRSVILKAIQYGNI
jgi:hypothetical protein